jgi:predicted AlkP superfamily phosphohydrolase/phosphomutase
MTSAQMSAGIAAVYCTLVRYLRMLTNSLIAGALAAAYVVILILHLNPTLPVTWAAVTPLSVRVGGFYAVYLTAIAYVLLVLRQLLGRDPFSPAWLSVDVLAWSGCVAASAGASVMWANVRTFGLVLETTTIQALSASAIVLAVVAVLLFVIALGQRRRTGRRFWATAVAVLVAASVVIPTALRWRATAGPVEGRTPGGALEMLPPLGGAPRVTVIALDAGSLEMITSATSEGRLPNFGRMLDSGAIAHLATLHPTSPEAVWAAIATGKFPQKNGVRSGAVYRLAGRPGDDPIRLLPDYCFATGLLRFGVLTQEPLTSEALRANALWTILSAAGLSVGVVNFPLTYPSPSVQGFVLSDAYLRLSALPSGVHDSASLYPPSLEPEAAAVLQAVDDGSLLPAALRDLAERHRVPARLDRIYERLHQALTSAHPVQVSLLRFQSLDQSGHYFLRYAMPFRFGDVTDEERRRYGGMLEAHYAIVDEAIGRAIAELGPDDLLLVVSGYGMEPLSVGKRLLEQVIGDPEISGSHESAPDGFLMAYGAAVARARQLRRAAIVDVVPTILYFLGLPVARDMDGYARPDLFRTEFTEERPITFIPSYDK